MYIRQVAVYIHVHAINTVHTDKMYTYPNTRVYYKQNDNAHRIQEAVHGIYT